MTRIGIIGLGRMGTAMAHRFADQGADVIGWTRSGRRIEGVKSAPDLSTLVASSDMLVLSLFDDTAVAEMLDALLAEDLSGKLIVETSTVVPDVLREREQALIAAGARAVDAPISGGPELVLAGQCGIFIGGEAQTVQEAQARLTLLTERIFHVGPLGAGLVMKTINNAMIQAYFCGLNELLPLAKRAGLSLETAANILASGPAGTPMFADRLPRLLGEDDSVGCAIEAVAKDADVFRRVVETHGLPAPLLTLFGAQARAAVDAGLGGLDAARMATAAYENGAQD
ncbi:NAD(P)-dependent oxidoreductase [Pontivivens insulae]|uniref:2-hydroxy-3-oxopropionate reductase n=1 Tax=Pontivivens insulae TaxID=1639689 RepID=A0A2R8AB64_9RHOB|nr:NAD(P)-dependent oxidoreductase [Pontivivens insulae]RED11355.1 3-hydroxyisobutyrate dehydrogenase [Pontivivens insulae]SPF29472.1 2-hydroxy-3-oxopropionate reductase [Pontivivens insulae]